MVISSTVTVKVHEPLFVCEVAVTTVVPTGKKSPEAGEEETDPQSPEDVGAGYVTCAPRCPFSVVFAVVVISAGQVKVQLPPPPLGGGELE